MLTLNTPKPEGPDINYPKNNQPSAKSPTKTSGKSQKPSADPSPESKNGLSNGRCSTVKIPSSSGQRLLLLGVLLRAAPSPAALCDYKLLRGLEAAPSFATLRPAPPPPPSGSEVLPYISPVICVCKLLRHPLSRPPPSYSGVLPPKLYKLCLSPLAPLRTKMSASKENCRSELREAIRQLTDRCLYSAAKWAGEQLVGIEQDPAKFTPANTRFQRGSSSIRRRFRTNDLASASASASTPFAGISYPSTTAMEDEEVADGDFYLLAKSYFDCREFRRAAHVLRDQVGRKSIFLRYYALYLAGEKRKEEEMIELEQLGVSEAENRELSLLETELSALRKSGTIDPFGLYLYGLVLKEKGNQNLARVVLVESVNSYPWNWSAWSELQCLCSSVEVLNNLNLSNHWMKDFFLASAYLELRMHNESLSKYEHLQGTFSFSNYVHAQIAKVQYSLREFEQVEVIFEEILRNDPYRVEDMDMYSNVLYAKECSSALSYLAHRVVMTDKYRPESCCIIGNYYSLKGQHEKSVMYFKRALKLNRKCLSAWTLMGHEYIEMKNTPAAIDAYRRAVDINPCDYRAWYGLGQAYEMMGMPLYALHYFKKAVHLQSNDSRLWIAMAHCYETNELHNLEEAIKCYMRAVNTIDAEAIALHQLAKLHLELGHSEEAAYFYRKDLERMEAEEREGPNMVETLIFLAEYCRDQKKFEEAEVYCTRLLDYTGPEKETAKNLLRGMRTSQSTFVLDGS